MAKTHNENKNDTLSAFRRIRAAQISDYPALVAAAVISGQAMDELPEETKSKFAGLAADIQDLAADEDEPRFCLYDYLDACVNGDADWEVIASQLGTAWEARDNQALHELFDRLVKMAADKRETYSN